MKGVILKGKGDMEDIDELSKEEILMYMYQDDNLEMKSEIKNPLALACFKVLGVYLASYKLKKSPKLIESILKIYLKYMISHNRLGREELFKTISSLFDRETIRMSISERLQTSSLKKK